jgi:hypothetical protein
MSKKAFFSTLPDWICSLVERKSCNNCQSGCKKAGIIAAGIRQSDATHSMFVEHKCVTCEHRTIINLGKDSSLEDLCVAMLEEMRKKKATERSKFLRAPHNQKPMTDKEVKLFLKKMNKSESFEDFMKDIGSTVIKKPNAKS